MPQKNKRPPLPPSPPGWTIREIPSQTLLGIYYIASHSVRFLDSDSSVHPYGLINDLDGGLHFWPKYINSENEMITLWQAYDMKEMLTEEYFAAHEIRNPQAHQKLKELVKNLAWDDNPVIVIGKLK